MSTYGYLAHYGILGQKWGIRRYQNTDGTLTAAGKVRYSKEIYKSFKSNKQKNNYGYKDYNGVSRKYANDIIDSNKQKYSGLYEKAKEFNKLIKLKREDFDKSKEYDEAYKKAVNAANNEMKKHPNDYPKEDYFPGSKYLDRLIDYFFYDEGYYDEAEKKWKQTNRSKTSNQIDKVWDDLIKESDKIVNNMIDKEIGNKKFNSLSINFHLANSIVTKVLEESK